MPVRPSATPSIDSSIWVAAQQRLVVRRRGAAAPACPGSKSRMHAESPRWSRRDSGAHSSWLVADVALRSLHRGRGDGDDKRTKLFFNRVGGLSIPGAGFAERDHVGVLVFGCWASHSLKRRSPRSAPRALRPSRHPRPVPRRTACDRPSSGTGHRPRPEPPRRCRWRVPGNPATPVDHPRGRSRCRGRPEGLRDQAIAATADRDGLSVQPELAHEHPLLVGKREAPQSPRSRSARKAPPGVRR